VKAVRFHEHGSPIVLHYEDASEPKPGVGEVLLRVRACGINHVDLDIREGISRLPLTFPHTLGIEVAGDIAGPDHTYPRWKAGDRVTVNFILYCRNCAPCRSGQDNICEGRKMLGVGLPGGYADYVVVPSHCVVPLPDGLSYEHAAATQVAFGTSWHMLITMGKLTAGESVLINSAGSGIGSAAVQIAKLIGARVFATVGADAKKEAIRELGADEVWNHQTQNIIEEVHRATRGHGVEVVYEHVGGETFRQSLECVAVCGRIVTCGAHAGEVVPLDIIPLFRKQIALIGCYTATSREIDTVLALVGQGKLKPVIHSILPLAEARQAHEVIASRRNVGKVVLQT
jgi:NADPH:quinone reductase-like Zn-dependent oxidoreductase